MLSYFPFPHPFPNLTDAASHSDAKAVWWHCIYLHVWVTALFPAGAQVCVNHACLQTAGRGWKGRVDPRRPSFWFGFETVQEVLQKTPLLTDGESVNYSVCWWSMLSDLSETRQQTLGEGEGQTADTCLGPGSSSAMFSTFHVSIFWHARAGFCNISVCLHH